MSGWVRRRKSLTKGPILKGGFSVHSWGRWVVQEGLLFLGQVGGSRGPAVQCLHINVRIQGRPLNLFRPKHKQKTKKPFVFIQGKRPHHYRAKHRAQNDSRNKSPLTLASIDMENPAPAKDGMNLRGTDIKPVECGV